MPLHADQHVTHKLRGADPKQAMAVRRVVVCVSHLMSST